jgi:hypothetical protein
LAGSLANTTDQAVAAVPVVRSILPSGTVSTVAGLVDVAVPPLVEAVPILEPVVQPVADLVTGATPLPALLPGVPDASGDLPEALAPDTAATPTGSDGTGSEASVSAVPDHAGNAADLVVIGSSLARTGSPAAATPGASFHQGPDQAPLTEDPSPAPVPAPAAPGSGAGSGASRSGPSGAAALLNDFDLDLPLSGTHPISGTSEQAPSPVSFDPGSSPD